MHFVHKSHQFAPCGKHKHQQTTEKEILFNRGMSSEMVLNTIYKLLGLILLCYKVKPAMENLSLQKYKGQMVAILSCSTFI